MCGMIIWFGARGGGAGVFLCGVAQPGVSWVGLYDIICLNWHLSFLLFLFREQVSPNLCILVVAIKMNNFVFLFQYGITFKRF